jgi:sterol desaturase/sphingolipid hydroxylase (fatty acid hydroxylase superfamily)
VPWSGIAIDPFETILSGIMPYTIPLFIAPFHLYTVFALNIALMLWATIVHSSLPWSGNAIFMTPRHGRGGARRAGRGGPGGFLTSGGRDHA